VCHRKKKERRRRLRGVVCFLTSLKGGERDIRKGRINVSPMIVEKG